MTKLIELLVGQDGGGLDEIGLGNFILGIGEAFGELGVVGEDEESAGVKIEAADGGNEIVDAGEEVVDGGSSFGILVGSEVALRLVEQEIKRLLRAEGFAVEENSVAVEVDPVVRIFDDAAVDLDAAGVDPGAGFGAGTESGFREDSFEGLEAFEPGVGRGGRRQSPSC